MVLGITEVAFLFRRRKANKTVSIELPAYNVNPINAEKLVRRARIHKGDTVGISARNQYFCGTEYVRVLAELVAEREPHHVILFGGHDKWRQRMSKALDNLGVTYSCEQVGEFIKNWG